MIKGRHREHGPAPDEPPSLRNGLSRRSLEISLSPGL
jgi:hypothetical protein